MLQSLLRRPRSSPRCRPDQRISAPFHSPTQSLSKITRAHGTIDRRWEQWLDHVFT
jgi:hypothetical protein